MSGTEIVTAVLVHLLVPGAGLGWYLLLCYRLRQQGASVVFLGQLFLIFFCWGGLLLILLTAVFWSWSGMASLGMSFLLFIAPLLLAGVAFSLSRIKHPTPAQRLALRACLSYYGALVLLFGSAFLLSH